MIFLRITAADGTRLYVPDNYVVQVCTAADTRDAGSNYRSPNVLRGRITSLEYLDGAAAAAPTITTVAVSAYVTGDILYEYGYITVDGAFVKMMSN